MRADWRNPVVVVDDDDECFTATVFVLVVVGNSRAVGGPGYSS